MGDAPARTFFERGCGFDSHLEVPLKEREVVFSELILPAFSDRTTT